MNNIMNNPDYRALCADLVAIEDALSGGSVQLSNQGQALDGYAALAAFRYIADKARIALDQPDQDDKTLKAIRETTPRYRMSVIVSTNDSAIDTRMNVIWQALDLSKEILESVSLPEQLPSLGNR